MDKFGSQCRHTSKAVIVACFFIIFIPTMSVCLSVDETIVQAAKGLDSLEFFHVNSNYTVEVQIELDMIMSIDEYKNYYGPANTDSRKRNAISSQNKRWKNGVVYYQIDDSIDSGRNAIKKAIAHWETYTCIKFIEQAFQLSGVTFKTGDRCASTVGRSTFPQVTYLGPACLKVPVIVHEIGHFIGFYHEHSRPDRDSYIKLNLEGQTERNKNNFKKLVSGVNDYDISYDYTSIMHYSAPGIITTLDPAYQKIIGNVPGLSFKDIKLANLMYKCSTLRSSCPEKSCPFNGFVFFKEFKGKPKCECFCESGNVSNPLVPCSSITQEVPDYNIPAVSDINSTGPSSCFDLQNDCKDLMAQGLCLTEIEQMVSQCAKTCNYCNKGQDVCMDYSGGCELMEASCSDPQMKEIARNECPKTCKVCSNPSSPCEIQQSYNEQISNAVSIKANLMNMFALMHIFSLFHV